MTQEGGKENPQPIPPLPQLVEDAYKRFQSKRSYVTEVGKVESYNEFVVGGETAMSFGPNYLALATALVREASITPGDIEVDIEVGDNESWDELLLRISSAIISAELLKAHPDVSEESHRRYMEFDN